jgi:hypothetical protein
MYRAGAAVSRFVDLSEKTSNRQGPREHAQTPEIKDEDGRRSEKRCDKPTKYV